MGLPADKFIAGYAGNHGRSQALEQILEAAKLAENSGVFFALFGDGPEKARLEKLAEEKQISNLRFYPSQPRDKMPFVQAQFDISIVPLKNISLFDGARPSKMFELMSGAIPFVFCGKGEGAELAKKSGCALICPPERPAELKDKITELKLAGGEKIAAMGKAGRDFVKQYYDREKIAADFYEKLIKAKGEEPQ